ncbi:hypothetical protein WAI453_011473 [Rhynchosporium graminicola]
MAKFPWKLVVRPKSNTRVHSCTTLYLALWLYRILVAKAFEDWISVQVVLELTSRIETADNLVVRILVECCRTSIGPPGTSYHPSALFGFTFGSFILALESRFSQIWNNTKLDPSIYRHVQTFIGHHDNLLGSVFQIWLDSAEDESLATKIVAWLPGGVQLYGERTLVTDGDCQWILVLETSTMSILFVDKASIKMISTAWNHATSELPGLSGISGFLVTEQAETRWWRNLVLSFIPPTREAIAVADRVREELNRV